MEQFKTLDDLRDYVKQLGKFCARSVISGEHPTLYLDHSQGRMVQGIREKDYLFSKKGTDLFSGGGWGHPLGFLSTTK